LENFLDTLWDNLTAVSLPLLVLGLAFQATQTLFVALAWRNILRAAYPDGGVQYDKTLAYYAGGNGLNAFLPASAGTVAMLGLFRTNIKGATVPGLLGATVVENIFFAFMGVVVYLWLFLSAAGSFDVHFSWLSAHWGAAILIVVGGIALLALVLRMLWHKLKHTWESAKEGGAILADKRKFATQVVAVEAISYAARMGVNATFMYAFDIPVSVKNVFLIVAAASISSTVAVLPGAVGAQTALANVVLAPVASAAAISAYSVGQAVITTAFNIAFGLILLAREIGWKAVRGMIHVKKQQDGEAAGDDAATVMAADPTVTPAPPE
jgi:uncharacterized membrane protein YbhN (UPF0104 family)